MVNILLDSPFFRYLPWLDHTLQASKMHFLNDKEIIAQRSRNSSALTVCDVTVVLFQLKHQLINPLEKRLWSNITCVRGKEGNIVEGELFCTGEIPFNNVWLLSHESHSQVIMVENEAIILSVFCCKFTLAREKFTKHIYEICYVTMLKEGCSHYSEHFTINFSFTDTCVSIWVAFNTACAVHIEDCRGWWLSGCHG